jgi:hypothetical protein
MGRRSLRIELEDEDDGAHGEQSAHAQCGDPSHLVHGGTIQPRAGIAPRGKLMPVGEVQFGVGRGLRKVLETIRLPARPSSRRVPVQPVLMAEGQVLRAAS